jgi:hypothetical protein
MSAYLPPPTPEQWTQMVLSAAGATAIYGASVGVVRLSRWLRHRAAQNLKVLTGGPDKDPIATEPEPEPRDPLVANLLELLSKDAEWEMKPHEDKNFSYLLSHPSGVCFATHSDTRKTGADAVYRFRVGDILLFDQTTKIDKGDAHDIETAAWEMASRITRSRVQAVVEPAVKKKEKEDVKSAPADHNPQKFAQAVQMIRNSWGVDARQLVAETRKLIDYEAAATYDPGNVTSCPEQWALFVDLDRQINAINDFDGKPVRVVPIAVHNVITPEEAAFRLVYAASWSLESGRTFRMAKFAPNVTPNYTASAELNPAYVWTSRAGVPVLTRGPARRYSVASGVHSIVIPTAVMTTFDDVCKLVVAWARKNAALHMPDLVTVTAYDDTNTPWTVGLLSTHDLRASRD